MPRPLAGNTQSVRSLSRGQGQTAVAYCRLPGGWAARYAICRLPLGRSAGARPAVSASGPNAAVAPSLAHVRSAPDERTFTRRPGRSETCHKRTHVKLCTQSGLAETDWIEATQPQRSPNILRPCGAGLSLRAPAELAAELSQGPAVRHADTGYLQSQHRTDCKTGVHSCRTP